MLGGQTRNLIRQNLPNFTNYKWIQYLVVFWSLRMSLLGLSMFIPLLSLLSTSQEIDIYNYKINEYDFNDISKNIININDLISKKIPFIINNFSNSFEFDQHNSQKIRNILDLELPKILSNVKISDSKEFIHFSNDQAWSIKYNTLRNYSIVNMDTEEFFAHRLNYDITSSSNNNNNNNNKFVYLSRQIHSPLTSIIIQTFVPNFNILPSLTGIVPEVRLWMSSKDVLATPHYDMEHNFFIQLNGTKQFILSSPIHYEVFQPHSYLHPYWRQSQNINMITVSNIQSSPHFSEQLRKKKISIINNNINNNNLTSCLNDNCLLNKLNDSSVSASVHEIILHSGQLLYIPPFYYHSVKALDSYSISLNSWIGSDYVQTAEKMRLNVPLPFNDRVDTGTKLSFIGQLIKATLIHLSIPISFQDFKKVMLSRVEINAFIDDDNQKSCDNDSICDTFFPYSRCTEKELQIAEFSNKVRHSMEKLSSHLSKFSPSIQKILLLDYFEEVLDTLVPPDASSELGIKCFIQKCLPE